MELRTLEYFLAVAREGNISNAAKALHITQPTLSRQLSSLEKEFGRELYTRGPKGIELTDQGSILCRYAESIVELARKAEEDMLPSERSIGGTSPADLVGQSVIASRQALAGTLRDWAGDALDRMDVVATFNLPLNGRYLVRQGMSCMLTYEGLFDASESSDLRFVPFAPRFEAHQGLVWRSSMPNKQTQAFLDAMERVCARHAEDDAGIS